VGREIDELTCGKKDQRLPFCTFNKKHFEAIFKITTIQPYKRRSS
jgi:hypothetical protein